MTFSPQERSYYDQLFAAVDTQDSGVLAGQDALPLLMSANLPQQTLGEIWALADPDNNGFLTRDAWYKAARIVGWMQKGAKTSVDESLGSQAGPLPTFQGQAPPPITPQATGRPALPPLTPTDRAKFTKIFVGCGPANGLVSGDKARDVFLKSQLNYDKLGQIWNLADTQSRGSLDLTDFIIGMYLIQSCMANPALNLPATLPPGTYEAASGGRAPASPIVRQNTGPASPIRAQYTGGMQPQRTGIATPTRSATLGSWDVTPDAKQTSDRFFAQLDPQNRGHIDGDVAVPFMLQSQLDEGTLAAIWDLADIRKEGRLNKDEFAVAMHLINNKLAGRDPPATLPTSLVPPSLRGDYSQQPQQPSSATKDLFDLFADEPITAPTTFPVPAPRNMSSPVPAPPRNIASPAVASPRITSPPPVKSPPAADLMGEESQPVSDHSAEIGNKRNQLANTTRGLESLAQERLNLEQAAASSAAELQDLETKLAAARSKHEAEKKAVADLKSRVSEQKEKFQSVNMDYIAAQSDVSALQSERDELEQALLAGKEEVRDLNRRMKEIAEEKSGLVLLLEKLKKETRQQKGMVSIAKKQLATAEGGRDSVQGEIRALEQEQEQAQALPSAQIASPTQAAAVPLPATPRALSPSATGVSQRSNNPFDRFRDGAKSPAGAFGAGALLGAAAGVVAAGAETLYEAAKDVVSPEPESEQVHEVAEHARDASESSHADFDSAFAEFDEPAGGIPSGIPKSAIPYLRPDTERTASTQAVLGESVPESPASTAGAGTSTLREATADDSSDEDDGPEDVEAPARYQSEPDNTPILYPPVQQEEPNIEAPKPRRSAPPPPPKAAATLDDLDPFGGDSGNVVHEPEQDEEADPFGASSGKRDGGDPFGAASGSNTIALDTADPFGAFTQQEAPLHDDSDPFGSSSSNKQVAANTDPFGASLDDAPAPSAAQGSGTDFSAPQAQGFGTDFSQPAAGADFSAPAQQNLGTAESSAQPSGFGNDDFVSAFSQQPQGEPPSGATGERQAESDKPPANQSLAPTNDTFPTPSSLPPGAAPAAIPSKNAASGFDDDDFDFSDAPPVQMTNEQPAPKAPQPQTTKDDFDFDDEFEQPSNSDGSKSYEMVSPPSGGLAPPIQQPADVWGSSHQAPAQPPAGQANAFSFDDAFGGDFEPSSTAQAGQSLNPPSLPQRRESGVGAQPDDIEDVKKLCAMGFPRSLVIEALGANGYDFQKTLNVLLQ